MKDNVEWFESGSGWYRTKLGNWNGRTWVYKDKIYIPKKVAWSFINEIHQTDLGLSHQGINRTVRGIRQRFYIVNLQRIVGDIINECGLCIRAKQRRFRLPMGYLKVPERKFDIIHLDYYGGKALPVCSGFRNILSIVDRVSGWTKFVPMKTRESRELISVLLKEWFAIYGLPREVHGDNESAFISRLLVEFFQEYNISYSACGAYRHAQNGQVERAQLWLTEGLRRSLVEATSRNRWKWTEVLPIIAYRLNIGWNRQIKETAYFVVFGKDPRLKMGVTTGERYMSERDLYKLEQMCVELRKRERKDMNSKDYKQKDMIEPQDLVWWFPKDGSRKFEMNDGPYRVQSVEGGSIVVITNLDTGRTTRAAMNDLFYFS